MARVNRVVVSRFLKIFLYLEQCGVLDPEKEYCSSDLGKRQLTNCCLLKFFENSINTVRTKIKDTNKLQVSLQNNRI